MRRHRSGGNVAPALVRRATCPQDCTSKSGQRRLHEASSPGVAIGRPITSGRVIILSVQGKPKHQVIWPGLGSRRRGIHSLRLRAGFA